MTAPESMSGPTVRRIMVGVQLRRLREAAGISREEAAYLIRGSASKISRLELGRVSFKDRDIADLLTRYGITDADQREAIIALARDAKNPGWWHSYDEVIPGWFQTYIGLEEAASAIRSYEVQFVPGLLQTEDYARAVITSGIPPAPADEVDRRIHLRMTRQKLLTRPNPLSIWIVLDEAVLIRPLGGRSVMRAQVEHLLAMTDLSTVTIQMMPLRLGGHVADGGGFSVLRFAEPDVPDVVYLEQLISALYLDRPEQVERYMQAMDRLAVDSLPPEQTADALARVLKRA